MQYLGAFILLITSLLSLTIAANEEEIVVSKEETEVLKTIKAMTSAFHKKDISGVLASYEAESAVMFEPGQRVSDPKDIQQLFEGAFQLSPKFDYPVGHEVYIASDIALHIAPWVMKGKIPDGTEIEQQGLSVSVLRKQENGQWLLVLDNPHGQVLLTK